MRLKSFLQRILRGSQGWAQLSEAERQGIMSKSTKDALALRRIGKHKRVNIGAQLPGEGDYTNSDTRDQFVGANDSALARSFAEERAQAIKDANRKS